MKRVKSGVVTVGIVALILLSVGLPASAATINIVEYFFTKVGAWETYSYTTPVGFPGFTLTTTRVAIGQYAGKLRVGDYKVSDPGKWTWVIFDFNLNRTVINMYASSGGIFNPPVALPAVQNTETLTQNPFESDVSWYFKTQPSYTVPAGTFNDVMVWFDLEQKYGPNKVNDAYGLDRTKVPYGVCGITWYARGLGELANLDVDSANGNTKWFYHLTGYGEGKAPQAPPASQLLLLTN